ncbi:putative transcription factor GRAS family [Helianthus anomalus]
MFDLRNDHVLAVNSVFEFHQLLARPGAIDKVLLAVKQMSPDILTAVDGGGGGGVGGGAEVNGEVDIGVNDGGVSLVNGDNKFMSEMYLGKHICGGAVVVRWC